jgi:hypothetical protein
LLDRRGEALFGCFVIRRQQKCKQVQRLQFLFKHSTEVHAVRTASAVRDF